MAGTFKAEPNDHNGHKVTRPYSAMFWTAITKGIPPAVQVGGAAFHLPGVPHQRQVDDYRLQRPGRGLLHGGAGHQVRSHVHGLAGDHWRRLR